MIVDLTRRFSVDGVTLAWDRWAAGSTDTPLLLCHGFSGSSHDFALSIEDLAAHRTVVTVDHRGHGRSQKLMALDRYSIDLLAADAIALIDRKLGGPVDLLGHSMGGAVALRVTLARPDLVRSLILMDTSGWSFVPQDLSLAELMAGFLESFEPSSGLPDLGAQPAISPESELIAAATPLEWQTIKEQMAAAFDPFALKALGVELFEAGSDSVRGRLGEIACPVTVIVGEHDHPFVDQAKELAASVGDGRLRVIPGAYHSPQLTHKAEWDAAVGEHLRRGR